MMIPCKMKRNNDLNQYNGSNWRKINESTGNPIIRIEADATLYKII